jgi:hypothetical protein
VRKMTVLGASALLVAGLMVSPAAAFAAPIAGAPVAIAGNGQETCPEDGKVEVVGSETSIVVTAPAGMVITGYCVKAGSDESDAGVEYVELDPYVTEVTIKHPSGKDISHYTVFYEPASTPSPSPSEPSEEPSGEPSEPGVEPSEPSVEPTDGSAAPVDEADATPSPSASEPPVLAATGASTVIGFTLIALALVGGGVTLIVLRRKGVLGS